MYESAAASDSDLTRMLRSMYMARMGFLRVRTGNGAHLRPHFVEEGPESDSSQPIRRTNSMDSSFDSQFNGHAEAQLDGFGIKFCRNGLDNNVHLARVAVLDFGMWKLKHYLHFLCK